MSAPRIKVVAQPRGTWLWRCTQHPHVLRAGEGVTTARSVPSWEAAMAEGLKHLRDWHPDAVWAAGGSVYSRRCGVPVGACAANECECVSVDPEGLNGPHNAAYAIRCPTCDAPPDWQCCTAWHSRLPDPHPARVTALADFGDGFPCCATPVQRAHNTSRGDA